MKSSIIGILGFIVGFIFGVFGGLSADSQSTELEKLNLRFGNIESQIIGKSELNEHLTKVQPFGNMSLRELILEVCDAEK